MKITKNQRKILFHLKQIEAEISAQDLYSKLRQQNINIGLATIYRTLKNLHLEGIIQERITLTGESLYKVIEEDISHSHHLNCVNCGECIIIDACPISEKLTQWCESQKFTVYYHTLEFFGLCDTCQEITNSSKNTLNLSD